MYSHSLLISLCIFKLIPYIECFVYSAITDPEYANPFKKDSFKLLPNEYEIVFLPMTLVFREAVSEKGETSMETTLDFTAFGRAIGLKLKPNNKLISPSFKTFLVDNNDNHTFLPFANENCHFLHQDSELTAAISLCQPNSVHGLLLLENTTLEILPLTSHIESALHLQEPLLSQLDDLEKVPHIVKKATVTPYNTDYPLNILSNDRIFSKQQEAASHRPVNPLTLELAVFFDAQAYKIFGPYFDYDDDKIRNMLLAYVNGIQALYHHPSLGTSLQLALVRLDIMKKQPSSMPHYDGERSQLLDSFCEYQQNLNPVNDENPDHWDMGLYVSGLDFFAYENGRKSGVTMGLATVGGVCLPQYACVISEFGTTNMFGKPYPSAGFTSVFISAHEIGHNLGMHHDSSGNNCPKEGYIMSPSRGVNGETQWSSCSADVMTKLNHLKCLQDSAAVPPTSLDHSKFFDNPGQVYTAKKQCEVLLQDKDASLAPNQKLSTICESIQCQTPHRSGYYYAGPALEGTECGYGMYCFGGNCVSKLLSTPLPQKSGGWGPWKLDTCTSGCLENSVGHQGRRRACNNPVPVNTDYGCEGSSYEIVLCKDEKICRKSKRVSVVEYASLKCKDFSSLLPQLDHNGAGLQAPHEEARVWMSCAIFCKRGDSGGYFTPRVELNDLGVSPYFPDGTWCHKDKHGENYFCLQHHCLPESFQFSKKPKLLHGFGEDLPIFQNAHPAGEIPYGLQPYFSLGPDGKPVQTKLKPGQATLPKEEDWESHDYRELPEHLNEIPNGDSADFDFMK